MGSARREGFQARPATARYRLATPALLVRPFRNENINGDLLLDDRRLLDLDNWELRMLCTMHG